MVARLLGDAIQRNLRWYAAAGAMLFFGGLAETMTSDGTSFRIAAMLLGPALFIGPILAISLPAQRELRHLPTTNRDLWRLTWCLATVVACSLVFVATLIGFSIGGARLSIESVVLLGLYAFAWNGVVLRLFVMMGYVMNRGGRQNAAVQIGKVLLVLTLLGVAFGPPLFLGSHLPARAAGFTPTFVVMLVACVAISIGTFFWTPQRTYSIDKLSAQKQLGSTPAGPGVLDRLTGIPRVLIPDMLLTIGGATVAALVLATTSLVAGDQDLDFIGPTAVMAALLGTWTPWARLLKVLPLTVGQISALMVSTQVAIWIVLSGIVTIVGLARGDDRLTIGFSLMIALAGICAFGNALLFRFQRQAAAIFLCGFITVPLMRLAASGPNALLVIIGVGALCIAAAFNKHTLTTSSSSASAYRKPAPLFGQSPQVDR